MTMARSHKAADALLRHPDIPSHIINQYIPDPHTLAILRETCTTLLQAVRDTDPGQACEFVRARGWTYPQDVCQQAASGGHLEVLQWARQNGCPWDGRTCRSAADGGHREVLQWARANGCSG